MAVYGRYATVCHPPFNQLPPFKNAGFATGDNKQGLYCPLVVIIMVMGKRRPGSSG